MILKLKLLCLAGDKRKHLTPIRTHALPLTSYI